MPSSQCNCGGTLEHVQLQVLGRRVNYFSVYWTVPGWYCATCGMELLEPSTIQALEQGGDELIALAGTPILQGPIASTATDQLAQYGWY